MLIDNPDVTVDELMTAARARILTLPRPVEYAFLMPSRPKMSAPDGDKYSTT